MRYWRIANSDGKVWLMPRQNTQVALNLYQPSGWKGRVLKAILPFCALLPECCSPFPIQDWSVDESIQTVLQGIFPDKKLEWALFEGTPSVHQKQVFQVFCDHEILAYCKVSDKDAIKNLFEQEAELLQELRSKGICSIPRCMYNGAIGNDGWQMIVFSTEKTVQSRTPHDWNERHQSFVDELQTKTLQVVPYEACDLAKSIQLLRERGDALPLCVDKTELERAFSHVENRCKGKMLKCSVMHGDFTPWNMFEERGRLFVFDWEYAFRCCPVGLDRYHFIIQTAFFERHWSAEKLMLRIQAQDGAWFDIEQLIYYLLLILSRFVGREPADRRMSDSALLTYWNRLIILCLNKK